MKRLTANLLLACLSIWLALFDHCLISLAEVSVNSEIAFVIVGQVGMVATVLLLLNGHAPTVLEMARSGASVRMKLVAFGLPLIVFFLSPFMLSDAVNRPRYGDQGKSVMNAHTWHDLTCCLLPWSPPKPDSESTSDRSGADAASHSAATPAAATRD